MPDRMQETCLANHAGSVLTAAINFHPLMCHKISLAALGHSEAAQISQRAFKKGLTMKLLNDLLSTDYGLMSLAVILIVIAIWIYFTVLFLGKISKAPASHPAKPMPRKP